LAAGDGGYRVGDAASAAVLRAGLRPGDLIATVNEQQVGNIEQDRELFEQVAAAGRARMAIVRGGERLVLSFPLE
jgi:general secretion pathway protein C